MAYIFGDSFDCYSVVADMTQGFWDVATLNASITLATGRFAGGQALNISGATLGTNSPVKTSPVATDPVHHITVAFRQTAALSGTTLGMYFQLSDAATNQCCIVFRSDGAILLISATPGGTVLATYTGATTAANQWFAYEFEVIINNTTGRFRVRKNGNTADDFDSGATLNTRPGANTQANKLTVAMSAAINAQQIDDLLWRSDAASVAWAGDLRTYVRMPATDAAVQFSRLGGATNFSQVSEARQDGATSYIFDSVVGHADFYGIAAIGVTPASVVAVTTRAFMQKSDAGSRSGAVQLKSGATTVQSTPAALSTTFAWMYRVDTVDPATGAAWTPTAVNSLQCGVILTA